MSEATGQIEREARQLVDAAARWLSAVPEDAEYAARTVDLEADAEAGAGSSDEGQLEDVGNGPGREHTEEYLCRGCPWCRAKAAAGPLGADTLDSIAHLLSTAAESLSLFAQSRREASQTAAQENDAADREDVDLGAVDHGATDHDAADHDAGRHEDAVIDWDDEDEDEFLAGEDDQKQAPAKEEKT